MKKCRTSNVKAKDVFTMYTREALRHPRLFLFVVVGGVGVQAAELIYPLYLKNLFNLLASETPTEGVMKGLLVIVGTIGVVQIAGWAFRRLQSYSMMLLESRAMANLYSQAFDYLIGHSYRFFISNFSGTLVRRVAKFAHAFEALMDSIVFRFLPTALFTIGAIFIIFLRSHALGVVLGIWVVFFILFQFFLGRWRHPLRVARAKADSKITGTLSDSISNHNTISLFSGAAHERTILRRVARFWQKATMRAWNADELIWAVQHFLMVGINIGLLYGAVVYWGRGLLTIGDLALLQTYLLGLFTQLMNINREVRRFYDGYADATETMELLQTPHEVADAPNASPLVITKREIAFDKVSFAFRRRTPVLKNFHLHIRGGEKVALVGPSGAGKTTITKLLLRLYNVQSGSVFIDGQDIAQVRQEDLRNAISFVPQEPILFHRTLMENIRYGRRNATKEEVLAASKQAHCHEFVSALPRKYNTYVGERGVKLSGGERQRIAIVRAILKDSPILVLDEATSSLDSESEALIQDALQTLMKGKTVLVIAHRLSTIMKMDRILVIEKGRVAAEGTHAELLSKEGLYQKLWSIQAGGFRDEPERPSSDPDAPMEPLVEDLDEK